MKKSFFSVVFALLFLVVFVSAAMAAAANVELYIE
jgi:hypothetical protein